MKTEKTFNQELFNYLKETFNVTALSDEMSSIIDIVEGSQSQPSDEVIEELIWKEIKPPHISQECEEFVKWEEAVYWVKWFRDNYQQPQKADLDKVLAMPLTIDLINARKELKLSLRDVAKNTAISPATISRIENGRPSLYEHWIKLWAFYSQKLYFKSHGLSL